MDCSGKIVRLVSSNFHELDGCWNTADLAISRVYDGLKEGELVFILLRMEFIKLDWLFSWWINIAITLKLKNLSLWKHEDMFYYEKLWSYASRVSDEIVCLWSIFSI